MTVNVIFFARLREKMGIPEVDIELKNSISIVQFQELLTIQYPQFADLPQPIVVAINHEFAQPEQMISDGDEVAFFPPVTGG